MNSLLISFLSLPGDAHVQEFCSGDIVHQRHSNSVNIQSYLLIDSFEISDQLTVFSNCQIGGEQKYTLSTIQKCYIKYLLIYIRQGERPQVILKSELITS